jgi:oxalate---CoA ligase
MSSESNQMNLSNSIGEHQGFPGDTQSCLPAHAISEKQSDPENQKDAGATRWNPNEPTHLRPLRMSGNRPPLICVFPGVPGARDMAEFLPDDQPIYEIYWPNMDRETNFPTVEQLASTFVQDLRKIQKRGPYQFCGYSTFGLVAYEMARVLLSEGEDVSFLALFDIWHPRYRQRLSLTDLAQYKFTRIVDRLGKYGRLLTQGKFDDVTSLMLELVVRTAKSMFWRTTRFIFRLTNRPVPRAMQVIESIASNQSYVPMPYPKRFILIRPESYFDKKVADPTVGWNVCAPEGIDVFFIPGEHGTIKDKPYVRGLVEKITPYLASAPKF